MSKYINVRFSLLIVLAVGFFLTNCEKEDLAFDAQDLSVEATQFTVNFNEAIETESLEGETIELRNHPFQRNRFTFNTLNAALECTDLGPAVFSGHKTVYAPSDATFEKLGLTAENVCTALDKETLTNILLYHVVDRGVPTRTRGCLEMIDGNISQISTRDYRLFINDSRIYYAFSQRGIGFRLRVFIIDEVLMPPSATIAEAAAGTEDFEVLFNAVVAADPAIAAALSDPEAIYTVFAPTNQAFVDLLGALNLGSLEELVDAIGVEGLSTVLLYHVVDACAFSNDLKDGQTVTTLQGEDLKIDLGNLSIIDKTSTPSGLVPEGLDILTSNGVIHTIDKVLLPDALLMNL